MSISPVGSSDCRDSPATHKQVKGKEVGQEKSNVRGWESCNDKKNSDTCRQPYVFRLLNHTPLLTGCFSRRRRRVLRFNHISADCLNLQGDRRKQKTVALRKNAQPVHRTVKSWRLRLSFLMKHRKQKVAHASPRSFSWTFFTFSSPWNTPSDPSKDTTTVTRTSLPLLRRKEFFFYPYVVPLRGKSYSHFSRLAKPHEALSGRIRKVDCNRPQECHFACSTSLQNRKPRHDAPSDLPGRKVNRRMLDKRET